MGGEINVGMSFSNFDEKITSLRQNHITISDWKQEDGTSTTNYIFKEYVTNTIKAEGTRTMHPKNNKNLKFYEVAFVTTENYNYGISDLVEGGVRLNKFDYIETNSQHAVDLNGNNTVDEGEIFSGKLNQKAYDNAKESGKLANYINFLN